MLQATYAARPERFRRQLLPPRRLLTFANYAAPAEPSPELILQHPELRDLRESQ
jgi:hypothetical protein